MYRSVAFPAPGAELTASLAVPPHAKALVVFAHGSGSSRFSPRNRYVAQVLNAAKIGTLLADLLTEAEAADRASVFDIELLANRLLAAIDWAGTNPDTAGLPVGVFGASTGAAAALVAAARSPDRVRAVVSRGGRPDLAGDALGRVTAPTLLLVGSSDYEVLRINAACLNRLGATVRQLQIVPHATHLFEEPGALEAVAEYACEWFKHYVDPSYVGRPLRPASPARAL